MADAAVRDVQISATGRRRSAHSLSRHRSIVGFFFALPLITVIACLVVYPAGYAVHLATLNKSMQHFVGLSNFTFLFGRSTFWMVVEQSCLFAVTAVIFKAFMGFVVAHFELPTQAATPEAASEQVPIRRHIDALWTLLTLELFLSRQGW